MGVFNQRFETLFPCTGALVCTVCFAPLLSFLVYLCSNVGPLGLLAVALPALFIPQSASLWVRLCCHQSHPPWLPISAPPTGLNECFFFISVVVRLPCSSIFCHFWLFFVFKLLSFFWLCEEVQCVYLRLHLLIFTFLNNNFSFFLEFYLPKDSDVFPGLSHVAFHNV